MSAMDERRPPYSLKAPGAPGGSLRLPGRGPFPRLDDHLVEPEVTRNEIIGGVRTVAMPAEPPHATQQSELDYLLRAHAAPGYRVAVELLTRHDQDSDFATDVCVFKDGLDPATGHRYLEEIAFEVVSEQSERLVKEKAVRMHRRGVRRIFTILVKGHRVCEWSPESQTWQPLEPAGHIADPCLVAPLAVRALLDAAAGDNAVVEALAAKGNPALRRREAEAEAKGEARGRAEGQAERAADDVLKVLEARSIAVSPAQRQEILSCRDLDRLSRWLHRAALASSADEVLADV
jgi:Putative restriction endonuclease